jgi:hypothetical protein
MRDALMNFGQFRPMRRRPQMMRRVVSEVLTKPVERSVE